MSKSQFKLRAKFLISIGAYGRLETVLEQFPNDLHGYRAALPFRLIDRMLARRNLSQINKLLPLKKFLPANQPQLFTSVIAELMQARPNSLEGMISDQNLHPLTRFEAMGWNNY